MRETLEAFEELAAHFAPQVLIVGGMAIVGLGLCLWLGGSRGARPVTAALCAAAGAIAAWLLARPEDTAIAAAVAAMVGLLVGAVLYKPLLGFVGAALGALAVAIVLAAPVLAAQPAWQWPAPNLGRGEFLAVDRTILTLGADALFAARKVLSALVHLSPPQLAGIALTALVIAALGIVTPRLVRLATCSVLGTMCIFVGMVMLLLYKGAQPIGRMYDNGPVYAAVFAAMATFGLAAGLLLDPHKTPRTAPGAKKGEAKCRSTSSHKHPRQ